MVGEAGFVPLQATSALLGSLPWVWNEKIVLKHSRRGFVILIRAAVVSVAAPALAEPESTHWPNYQEGDLTISNYKFASGETLPQLKLHYRTLGSAERNAAGVIVNGVLLL